jgi:CDP-ribitol ribitolphosphotransferase
VTKRRKTQFLRRANVIDVSESTQEIEHLVACSDLLITDYSSIMFEFALIDKPTILFVPDQIDYSQSRGLYFPLDEYCYGNKAINEQQLKSQIETPWIDTVKLTSLKRKHLGSCTKDAASTIIKLLIAPAL